MNDLACKTDLAEMDDKLMTKANQTSLVRLQDEMALDYFRCDKADKMRDDLDI